MDVYIYSLSDPTTGSIRYVGKSISPDMRFKKHLYRMENTHKFCWIQGLLSAGKQPVLDILQTITNSDDSDWQEHEQWWIAYLKFLGCDLTNLNGGGRGGIRPSAETLRKLSESHKGYIARPETRRKLSEANRGKVRSPETRMRMSKAQTGKRYSEARREEMSKSRKGTMTPEHLALMCRLSKTKEAIAKMAEGLRRANLRPDVKAKHEARVAGLRRPVKQLDASTGEVLRIFPSIKDASEQCGINKSHIGSCARGRKWFRTAGGFKWELYVAGTGGTSI